LPNDLTKYESFDDILLLFISKIPLKKKGNQNCQKKLLKNYNHEFDRNILLLIAIKYLTYAV